MPTNPFNRKPVVTVTAQGRLLQVKAHLDEDDIRRGGGRRGSVTEFTAQSRLRLFRMLARIKAPESKGYRSRVSFLTLTTREIYHPRVFKVYLFRLLRRLKQKYPTMAVVWRLEYQKRGAPHCHCILYNAPYIKKDWIAQAWAKITGELKPFTRIEMVRAYRQLMSYASKYVGKVEAEGGFNSVTYSDKTEGLSACELETPGRVWGVYNRAALPFDVEETAEIPQDGTWWLIRAYCRRFFPWVQEDSMLGFTVFIDDPYHGLQHILRLSAQFGAVQTR